MNGKIKGVEEWRKIPGLPSHFEVSSLGRLKRLSCINSIGRRLAQKYCKFSTYLYSREFRRSFSVGGLVLLAFVGPPPFAAALARHLDDNRKNNKPQNLAWGTHKDNRQDAIRNGILGPGSKASKILSRKLLGNKRALGYRHDAKTLRKIRMARKGQKPAQGKTWKLSAETREHQRLAALRRWQLRREERAL